MTDPLDSARTLITRARRLYATDANVLAELDELDARLGEPLRVAIVGSVKAGKSTLLNGLLGERIAPTDSRECTRIVTWYRYDSTPRVRAQLTNGDTVSLPAKRQHGRLELDLGDITSEDFGRLEVAWPAPGIQGITLIDTPGIASISQDAANHTNRFLLPEQGAAGADAVVYLLRSLHDSDVQYMQALNERTRYGHAAGGSIAVLSRADELGAGRLSAMFSINQAVERLRNSPALDGIYETIIPVAGLMGMGAMSLRQADFQVFSALAALDAEQSKHLMLSGERFITAKDEGLPSELTRIDLIDRFGMYGIRLALASVRGGVSSADALASELLRRSGLDELRRVIDVHFMQRQSELKAHSAVLALHQLVRQHPVHGSQDLLVMTDDHMKAAHTFTEMQLVGRIGSGRLNLSAPQVEELERLIGGRGADAAIRLGIEQAHADTPTLVCAATTHLQRWRELASNPLLDRETHQACKTAERSCEALLVTLMSNSSMSEEAMSEEALSGEPTRGASLHQA